jgi:hypothetical protein
MHAAAEAGEERLLFAIGPGFEDFAPGATGAVTATLTLGASNMLLAPPTIALSGLGVAPNTGPQGTPGQTGPHGKTGPQGPRGKNGKVEVITCKTVTVHHIGRRSARVPLRGR